MMFRARSNGPLGGFVAPTWVMASLFAATSALSGEDAARDEVGPNVRTLIGGTGYLIAVAFSPDGRWIVTGGEYDQLRIWDTETGREVRSLPTELGSVRSVAFSADGKRIGSAGLSGKAMEISRTLFSKHYASEAGLIEVWNVGDGQLVRRLTDPHSYIRAIALNQDGSQVAALDYGDSLKVWDVTEKHLPAVIDDHKWEGDNFLTPAIQFGASQDLQFIVARSAERNANRIVKTWDTSTARAGILGGPAESIACVAISSSGKLAVASSHPSILTLWDYDDRKVLRTIEARAPEDPVEPNFLTFSPDETKIVSGSPDGLVQLWQVETGRQLQAVKGPRGYVRALAFLRDGLIVASGGFDSLEGGLDPETRTIRFEPLKIWDIPYDRRAENP